MATDFTDQLEKAKAHFEAFELREAYKIFRRYYDRLPFSPEDAHGQYIGMFARTLVELGKQFELDFYVAELERLYERTKAPFVGYPLAMIYSYLHQPRWGLAREILEKIISDPTAGDYRAKAKMLLAFFYEEKDDFAACHSLIESIDGPLEDPVLRAILSIWKGALATRRGEYETAHRILRDLLQSSVAKRNWYVFFSAKLIMAELYLAETRYGEAKRILSDINNYFGGTPTKSIQTQMNHLLKRVQTAREQDPNVAADGERLSLENLPAE